MPVLMFVEVFVAAFGVSLILGGKRDRDLLFGAFLILVATFMFATHYGGA